MYYSAKNNTLQTSDKLIVPGQYADIKFGDSDGDGNLDLIYGGNNIAVAGNDIQLNDRTDIFIDCENDKKLEIILAG